MLNLFLQGRSVVQHNGCEDLVDAGCGFTLMDCAMPMRTVADPHESIHLLLPRSRVVPLLGPRPYRARPEGGARVWAAARGRCKHRAARYALRALSPLGAAALAPATRLDRASSRGFDQLAGTTRQYGRSR
jgi:hypothetical protein